MAEFSGHVRAMRADNEFFGAEDLLDLGDVPFQIDRCERFENRIACGKKQKEMFTLFLRDPKGNLAKKEFWLKAENRKKLTLLYGPHVGRWKGQWIWLYVTEVRSPNGGMTLGIRIRDKKDAPPGSDSKGESPVGDTCERTVRTRKAGDPLLSDDASTKPLEQMVGD